MFFRLSCMAFVLIFLSLHQSYAMTFYVSSPDGIDEANGGTDVSHPLKTINKALNLASSSGDIIYVMTGTYVETINIDQNGVTLSAYKNHHPVIDGQELLPNNDWGSLINIKGDNNTLSGFEVKNCNINGSHKGGYAVWITGAHNTVNKMNVHHSWENGIIIQGDYNTVEDSMVWQTARQNLNGAGNGWSSGLSAARNTSSAALKPGITSYATIRHNKVFNNWGEGLSCYEADHCTIEDNDIYDNFTVNLYLSDATNSLVQRNMIYISSAPAITIRNNAHSGLAMFDEVASVPRSAHNKVINNFLYNADLSAFSWTKVENSGLHDTLIANNTIVDGNLNVGAGGSPNVVNKYSQIINNIITGKDSSISSSNGITFNKNNWAVAPTAAISATDINDDPVINKVGSTMPGGLTPDFFKIQSD
ncbi:MAG: right-handed parallel beta-helix repeat-containing protein, partial [Pseudobdellovibrionaceae bacterium]